MTTIRIHTVPAYDVVIGSGALGGLGEALGGYERVLLVSDETVFALHGDRICAALRGRDRALCVLPSGEEHKTLESLGVILQSAAEHRLGRRDCMIALGGGVIGDMTGFAAAVYMRGIDYIQIPTTLLSAVDASVGGKTAVDLPQGKNLAGAFHRPERVLCDCDLLATLPKRQFSNGIAEVVKHGVLRDEGILDLIRDGHIEDMEDLIARNVRVKQSVVEADEREAGPRRILNFGHTVGHAVERLSGYDLPHGEAVAIGMATELKIGQRLGITDPALVSSVITLLKRWELPVETALPRHELIGIMRIDKKNRNGRIVFDLPEKPGLVRELALTEDELSKLFLP